ncbi:MAG: hypothetical protein ACMUIP_12970 [bacterium]
MMLESKDGVHKTQNITYTEYDRLLDEISKFEENLTMDIRLLTQRLVDTENRLQKSIRELLHLMNNNNGVKYGVM